MQPGRSGNDDDTGTDWPGLALVTELAVDLPPVVGHRGQLREVFVNIVQNAIDELAPLADRERTLRIRTSRTQRNRISVMIEDSGGGITPDRMANLFTAFVSTKRRGMGLGLSLCQMIVERHDGQLSVSSDVGQGTRFEISLPADPTPAESPRSPARSINVEA